MEAIHSQERNHEDCLENEIPTWVKPEFEVIGISLECTAYAGAV